jgi:hypothetical protein
MRGFELNRLSWIGWLLLFATLGFIAAEIVVVGLYVDRGNQLQEIARRLIYLGLIFLVNGFFEGMRRLLHVFGVFIYRW